jgi:TolB-like protein
MVPERLDVERQLDAILASEHFVSAPKMRALLRYLVEATLAGDAARLKGYAIGVDVFDRNADFDPGTDPIVRVQVGRLRKLLDAFYKSEGSTRVLRIDIPKGGNAVEFRECDGSASPDAVGAATQGRPRGASTFLSAARSRLFHGLGLPFVIPLVLAIAALLAVDLIGYFNLRSSTEQHAVAPSGPVPDVEAITLVVLPFTDRTSGGTKQHFADGLTEALTTALSRAKSIALSSRASAFQYREAEDLRRVGQELGIRYALEGGVQVEGNKWLINVHLVDVLTGLHVWAQDYDRVALDELALQSEIVQTLASEIRPQLFSAAKRAAESRPPGRVTAWELFLQSTWMPGEARNSLAWEKERIELAWRALKINPDLGQAHSVLADKLAYLADVDPPSDTEAQRAEAALHARRALELAPGDADVMFNISVHHWHSGHLNEAIEATKRTLELDPNHILARLHAMVFPYTCSEVPPIVIDNVLALDASISPDNPVRWVTLLWLSMLYMNNGEFDRALEFARRADRIFQSPDTSLRQAVLHVQVGMTAEGVELVNEQRENWPNLDPRHYAQVTIARRCNGGEKTAFLQRIYGMLADAVDAAKPRG